MKFPSSINGGLLLLTAAVVLGFVVIVGLGAGFDRGLLIDLALREGRSPDWLLSLARWISWIGNSEQATFLILPIGAWLVWDRRFAAALAMLVMPPFATTTAAALKEGFARSRPSAVPHVDQVYDLSYPSGHATGAAAACVLIALLFPGSNPRVRMAIALFVAGLIGLSRMQLGVHYPSDVLGGWLWGAGMALIGFGVSTRLPTSRHAP
jgi:undecaprenyl-diphosphatase